MANSNDRDEFRKTVQELKDKDNEYKKLQYDFSTVESFNGVAVAGGVPLINGTAHENDRGGREKKKKENEVARRFLREVDKYLNDLNRELAWLENQINISREKIVEFKKDIETAENHLTEIQLVREEFGKTGELNRDKAVNVLAKRGVKVDKNASDDAILYLLYEQQNMVVEELTEIQMKLNTETKRLQGLEKIRKTKEQHKKEYLDTPEDKKDDFIAEAKKSNDHQKINTALEASKDQSKLQKDFDSSNSVEYISYEEELLTEMEAALEAGESIEFALESNDITSQ